MSKRRILIVDDETAVSEVAQAILARNGYEVVTAINGEAAKSIIEGGALDLVLSDVQMQNGDGFFVTKTAKAHRKDLPVILSSGNLGPDEVKDAGADAFISKPYHPNEIVALVQKLEKVTYGEAEELLGTLGILLASEGAQREMFVWQRATIRAFSRVVCDENSCTLLELRNLARSTPLQIASKRIYFELKLIADGFPAPTLS